MLLHADDLLCLMGIYVYSISYTEIIIDMYIQYTTVLHKWSLISYLPSREEFVETGDLPEFLMYLIAWVSRNNYSKEICFVSICKHIKLFIY